MIVKLKVGQKVLEITEDSLLLYNGVLCKIYMEKIENELTNYIFVKPKIFFDLLDNNFIYTNDDVQKAGKEKLSPDASDKIKFYKFNINEIVKHDEYFPKTINKIDEYMDFDIEKYLERSKNKIGEIRKISMEYYEADHNRVSLVIIAFNDKPVIMSNYNCETIMDFRYGIGYSDELYMKSKEIVKEIRKYIKTHYPDILVTREIKCNYVFFEK